ncbi:MAG: DUF444 family protein [Candidatus Liptonbacteria bacterium]|nr:DUF444 family protein [Candidatus Liptonbacteria bacterium]
MARFNDPKEGAGKARHSDRTAGDRLRHRQKVKDAISGNIGDIIAEESIIGKDKNRVVKVPIRGVKEYRFVYGENTPGVGQGGDGEVQPGQTVGQGKKGAQGQQAGDQAGVDYYETEINLDELIEMMFQDLELPYLERKKFREMEVEKKFKKKGFKRKGQRNKLHPKKTQIQHIKAEQGSVRAIEAIKREIENFKNKGLLKEAEVLEKTLERRLSELEIYRSRLNMREGRENKIPITRDDMRYSRTVLEIRKDSNAVVLCIMDTSGSMDTMKKYLARSFFFFLYRFLTTRYKNVEIVFIAHHTEARDVSEEEFFHKGESGGTFISSGYNKALEIIKERFPPSLWNVYAFHCSDGDNFESDNAAALKAARELADVSNLFGYGEIKPLGAGYYGSSMIQYFSQVDRPNFHTVQISRKEDVWPAFKSFLAKDKVKEE